MEAHSLTKLRSWKEWQQSEDGARLFPGPYSLLWFIRQNEEKLVQSGAMVKMRNQWHFVFPAFEEAILEILWQKTNRGRDGT